MVSLVLYTIYLLTLVRTYLRRGLIGQGLILKEKVLGSLNWALMCLSTASKLVDNDFPLWG